MLTRAAFTDNDFSACDAVPLQAGVPLSPLPARSAAAAGPWGADSRAAPVGPTAAAGFWRRSRTSSPSWSAIRGMPFAAATPGVSGGCGGPNGTNRSVGTPRFGRATGRPLHSPKRSFTARSRSGTPEAFNRSPWRQTCCCAYPSGPGSV